MIKENDIRPAGLFKKYLELSAIDAVDYFHSSTRKVIPCPACGAADNEVAFEKWGFNYDLCSNCGTLYQSPRPAQEDFHRFYRESPSAYYWSRTFLPAVAEARRIHLSQPKVLDLVRLCAADKFSPLVLADIGAGNGLFLEEWRRVFPDSRLIAFEPNSDSSAQCRAKNLEVVECFVEEAQTLLSQVDLVTAFEVIEHVHDPLSFCVSLAKLLKEDGRVLLTGPTIDGFDIQILWEHSNSISSPHHINFLSIQGFRILLEKAGFSDVHILTPGKLDVNIVQNAVEDRPDILARQRFLRTLLRQSEETLQAFQNFLREHQMSSHCWAWARKS